MSTMRIGSGDCASLLSGKHTKAHRQLLVKVITGDYPYYNAKMSPIDAFRGGAYLEEAYFNHLSNDWYTQHRVTCKDMPILVSTLDFVRLERGKIVEAVEMKSVNFDAFIAIPKDEEERLGLIKSKYRDNYRQVQFQLLCSGLDCITFKQVLIYDASDDEANATREFYENEEKNTVIYRDEAVINEIKERAQIFQSLKDYYEKA